MRFGVCTSITNAGVLKAAGYDYVEENVQNFLQPGVAEGEWRGRELAEGAALPVEAANVLMPPHLKVVGPAADLKLLTAHMETVLSRARQVGIRLIVFGRGNARKIEEGFDAARARGQLLDFARMSADLAARHDVTILAEHLRKAETNVLNSLADAIGLAREVGSPHFQAIADSYHYWEEGETVETLAAAMPWVRHVHVADRFNAAGGGAKFEGALAEYVPFFRTVKAAEYDGRISVEASWNPGLAESAGVVLERLKGLWARA